MTEFSIINPVTGQILRTGNVPFDDLGRQAGLGEVVLQGAYPDEQVWFDPEDGRIETRPFLTERTHIEIIADGVETAVVVAYVPPGTRMRSGALDERGRPTGTWQDVSAEQLVFCTEEPGAYRFTIDPPFPWRPAEVTLLANYPA